MSDDKLDSSAESQVPAETTKPENTTDADATKTDSTDNENGSSSKKTKPDDPWKQIREGYFNGLKKRKKDEAESAKNDNNPIRSQMARFESLMLELTEICQKNFSNIFDYLRQKWTPEKEQESSGQKARREMLEQCEKKFKEARKIRNDVLSEGIKEKAKEFEDKFNERRLPEITKEKKELNKGIKEKAKEFEDKFNERRLPEITKEKKELNKEIQKFTLEKLSDTQDKNKILPEDKKEEEDVNNEEQDNDNTLSNE